MQQLCSSVRELNDKCPGSCLCLLCTYYCHAPHTPGRAQVGIIGDLHELLNQFPTPGDNFMLQIPYILYMDSKQNENSWINAPTQGTNYADNCYKSSPIARPGVGKD